MSTVLVVGGAGYIGSHMVKHLQRAGHVVVVLDDLSSGYQNAVRDSELVVGTAADQALLENVFGCHYFDAVMHFASFIQVGESVVNPSKYYTNNLAVTLTLLNTMRKSGVRNFIFSSTAAVYGEPTYIPIDETHQKLPINPYGRSKWMVEQILEDYDHAYGVKSVCLRYFNAAGASLCGFLGERHEPETHLIPLVLQAASGRRSEITVFGRDYDTPDGTCIRDYIHVVDLVDAHARALEYLLQGGESTALNLGNGNGFSVQEVIDTAQLVTGRNIRVVDALRRQGDPPRLVADASKARTILGWNPCYNNLEIIVKHAWKWEQKWPW